MECPNCKKVIPDGSIFCSHCGHRMEENSRMMKCSNPQCGKAIPSDSKFCPFCGEPQATSSMNLPKLVFPNFTIVLGETTIQELIDISEEKELGYEQEEQDDAWSGYLFASGVYVGATAINSPVLAVSTEENENLSTWNQIIPIDGEWSIKKIADYCRKSNLQFQVYEEKLILILLFDVHCVLGFRKEGIVMYKLLGCPKCSGYDLQLEKPESSSGLLLRCKSCKNKFDMIEVYLNLKVCPSCGSTDIIDDGSGHVQFSCKDCGYIWGDEEDNNNDEETEDEYEEDEYEDDVEDEDDEDEDASPSCPMCGCSIVEDDGSNYLQYTCSSCGHNWGHDGTEECPECGSDDVENDGSDYLQYTCNNCGHNWGDEL